MLRIYVDFNSRERFGRVFIRLGPPNNEHLNESMLQEGMTVLLDSEDMQSHGVLARGVYGDWVCDIVPGSNRHLPPSEWDRFKKKPSD